MKKNQSLNLTDLINLNEEKEQAIIQEETSNPETIQQPQTAQKGRTPIPYKEAKYSFGMKEEDFNLLRAFCTIKSKSIKETIQEAIEEYLEKPENDSTIQEAKKLLKMIQKSNK